MVSCSASLVVGALVACWWLSNAGVEPPGAPRVNANAVDMSPSTICTEAAIPDHERAGHVSLDARNLPLGDALALLTRQTGVRFEIAPTLASSRVTRQLADVTLHTALTMLLDGLDWLELFDSSGDLPARLSVVSVYPRGATHEVLADLASNTARRQATDKLWDAARAELQGLSVAIADMESQPNLEAPDLDPADQTDPWEGS
jgi:hypothetical protein